jgi:hypothetical protein
MADTKIIGLGDETEYYDPWYDGYLVMEKFQASVTAEIHSLRMLIGSASGSANLGIYADSAGSPGSLLGTSGSFDCTSTGWKTLTISSINVTQSAYYWLSLATTSGAGLRRDVGSAPTLYKYTGDLTMPDPAGTGYSSYAAHIAVAAWGAEASSGSIIPILTLYRQRRI